MITRRHLLSIIAFTAAATIVIECGCAKHSAEPLHAGPPQTTQSSQVRQVVTLPSGYQLKLIQVGPMYSTTAHRNIAVMLAYETNIPLNDRASLAHEADGIFKYFRVNAERLGYSSAILSATEPAQGTIISHSDGFRFVYERSRSGTWRRTDADKNP